MGRYFALTLDLPHQVKTKTRVSKTTKKGNAFGFFALILLVVLGTVYILEVNSISTRGYEIKNLETRLMELKEANKRFELEAASLRSINNLEASVRTLNLIPISGVNYLKDGRYSYNN